MTFRTFFLLNFLLSISLCFSFTFIPIKVETLIHSLVHIPQFNSAFIGLLSLIVSILSYIGLLLSHYYAHKRDTALRIKKEADRINLEEIHNELKAMGLI